MALEEAQRSADFTRWVLAQTAEDTPTGDLARDARSDDCWPSTGDLVDHLLHLHDWHGASEDCLRALVAAWEQHGREYSTPEVTSA